MSKNKSHPYNHIQEIFEALHKDLYLHKLSSENYEIICDVLRYLYSRGFLNVK